MSIRGEERGAHWTGWVGRTSQKRGTPGKRKTALAEGTWEEGGAGQGAGVGAGEKDGPPRGFGKTGAQGCWGREAAYRGAGEGKPPGRRPGGLGVALKFGAAGPRSKKANAGWGRALRVGETRGRVIAGKSKWRVKLVRLPGGGEQAGECGQEHEAGQESRGGREAVGTE